MIMLDSVHINSIFGIKVCKTNCKINLYSNHYLFHNDHRSQKKVKGIFVSFGQSFFFIFYLFWNLCREGILHKLSNLILNYISKTFLHPKLYFDLSAEGRLKVFWMHMKRISNIEIFSIETRQIIAEDILALKKCNSNYVFYAFCLNIHV